MKTLFVSSTGEMVQSTGGGSTERLLAEIFSELGEVVLMMPVVFEMNRNDVSSLHMFKNVYSFNEKGIPLFMNPLYLRFFRKVVKKERPDVVVIAASFGSFPICLFTPRYSMLIYLSHIFEYGLLRKVDPGIAGLLKALRTKFLEKVVCEVSDHVIAVSYDDRDSISKTYRVLLSKISVVRSSKRNFLEAKRIPFPEARGRLGISPEKTIVLFHGSFNHPPNQTAFERISERIAPIVFQKNKDIEFIIAGFGVPVFAQDNVHSVGYVEDLMDLIDASNMAVMPLEIGGGVRIKMIDYMSRGIPVIATVEAMEGIAYSNGKDVLIASDDNEFADEIINLHEDPERGKMIGGAAKQYAMDNFSQTAAKRDVERLLTNLRVLPSD